MASEIGIGIVGFGDWARSAYAPALREMSDVNVVAVAARSDETLAAAREAFGVGLRGYHNYHDLLADECVAAVMVATPNDLHVEVATWALKAGKHVFVEAPIAETPDKTFAFIDEAESLVTESPGGLVVQTDLELGYTPVLSRLREMLDEEAIGEALSVTCRLWCDWGVGGKANREDSNRMGFFLWVGPWYFQIFDVLLGRLPERVGVTGVQAMSGTLMDHGWASLDYGKDDGARLVGRFEFNLLAPEGQSITVDVVGTQGEARADLTAGEIRQRTSQSNAWQSEHVPAIEPIVAFAGMRECLAGFTRAIRQGEPVLADLASCRRVHQVCFAAQRAADDGTVVDLSPLEPNE